MFRTIASWQRFAHSSVTAVVLLVSVHAACLAAQDKASVSTPEDSVRALSGELKLTSVKYDSLTVRIYGDVAVLRGVADNTGTYRGFPFSGKLRYTRVFVRGADRWQAVGMQHTMLQ